MMKLLLSKRSLLLAAMIVASFGISGALFAQGRVSGKVLSSEDEGPLAGLTVSEQGTTNGALTNDEGEFSLVTETKNPILVFSYVGFQRQEVAVEGRSVVNISMLPMSLEEVVVVGYGTQTKREVTGAIVQLGSEEIDKVATSDIATALQGQLAGVSVRNGSGRPGENSQILIRGVTSFQAGGSEPMYVVDGVTYLSNPNITPQEIESIEVLKDGASAAIYGARASAGVIIITTKRGSQGLHVNLDSYYGIQSIRSGIPLANTIEQLYITDLRQRDQTSGVFNPLQFNLDGLDFDTDWYDILQVDNAPIQNYTLNVNGGSKYLNYSVIGTFFNQGGSLLNSNYDKYSLRSNTTFEKGKFKAQTNIGLNISRQDREPFALIFDATRLEPYRRPVASNQDNDDLDLNVDGTNPERVAGFAGKLRQESSRDGTQLNGNLQLTYEIFKGFKATANLGGSVNRVTDRLFIPRFDVFDNEGNLNEAAGNPNTSLRLSTGETVRTIAELILTYDRTFGDHKVRLLGVKNYETANYNWYQTGANFITSVNTPTISNGEPIVGQQNITESNIDSWVGRAFYSYKSKYSISAVIRRDASSNFGPNNRVGYFPSISGAWNFSEEAFLDGIADVLTLGKIRVGYGTTGSDRIPPYAFSPVVISNVDYPFGNTNDLTSGFTQPGFADPNLKWETNISRNLGIDLEFWSGRAGFTADIYRQDKNDMLLSILTPVSAGATPLAQFNRYLTNIGDLRNQGYELSAFYTQPIGQRSSIRFSGMLTSNENTVVSLSREGEIIFDGWPNILRRNQTNPVAVLKEGLPVGAFYVFETDGVVKTEEELAAYQILDPEAQLGDLRYVDTNGDSVLNVNDKVYKGTYQPAFEYGLNFDITIRRFDVTLQFYGVQGATVYNGPKQFAYSSKRHKDQVYGWSEANPNSDIPTPRTIIEHPNVQTDTDFFLEDGSFLRLRNVILGYTFNPGMLSKIGVDQLRVYASAQNAITWTQYTGFDPEVSSNNPFNGGLDQGKYPVSTVYRVGLSLKF
ncbi:MAG: SusC/RagA family TonB-linked outer membrane protein [Bacteroidota bacterium]